MALVSATRIIALADVCALHEAREGSGYDKYVGWTVDELRQVVWVPIAVKPVKADGPAGAIVRISSCGAPRGAELVVYTATVSRR